MKHKKIILVLIITFSTLITTVSFYFYQVGFSPNILLDKEDRYVYIRPGITFTELVEELHNDRVINDAISFAFLSKILDYQENIRPGRYFLKSGWNNKEALYELRYGQQVPLKITFNNVRFVGELAPKFTDKLIADDSSFNRLLSDEAYLAELGFNKKNIIAMFIPNTYDLYWTTDSKGVFERMQWEYKRFWNESRLEKARQLNLSPIEVSTLASIVHSETNRADERPKVAGLYLNRLRKGMMLEADPTVKFAMGDFGLTRILYSHLEHESPYNTYRNKGLPPGPICMPDINAIDAVLNFEKHDYIFMCGRGDGTGYHNFAKTNDEHNRNKVLYKKNLKILAKKNDNK